MTNADKIWTTLNNAGPMCDDCLSSSSFVKPRQTVNIKCREMVRTGKLTRQKDMCPVCRVTKVVNRQLENGAFLPRSTNTDVGIQRVKSKLGTQNFSEGVFPSKKFESILESFANQVGSGSIDIYNEFSLQHELGIFLRNAINDRKVQFERNVSYFGFERGDFEKREIDIVLYENSKSLLDIAIELKFPRNGQHPEQMYSFCKDVVFAEQLKRSGFNRTFVVIFAEDRLFYEGTQSGIYGFFRGGRNLTGTVRKPTGARDTELTITGDYAVKWHEVSGSLKYTVIEAR